MLNEEILWAANQAGSLSALPTLEASTAAPQPLRRTPHMDLSPAPPVPPGARLKVSVYTDAEALRPGESGDDVILEGPAEQNRFDVQVWLVVGGPFTIEGPAVRPLTIRRDQKSSRTRWP